MTVWLYRLRDDTDSLLYVGITVDSVGQRVREHQKKAWGDRIVTIISQPYPDRASALAAEKEAVATGRPQYNKAPGGNPGGNTLTATHAKRVMPDVDGWLLAKRQAGHTYDDIARDLYRTTDQQLHLSASTIRRWVKRLKSEDA